MKKIFIVGLFLLIGCGNGGSNTSGPIVQESKIPTDIMYCIPERHIPPLCECPGATSRPPDIFFTFNSDSTGTWWNKRIWGCKCEDKKPCAVYLQTNFKFTFQETEKGWVTATTKDVYYLGQYLSFLISGKTVYAMVEEVGQFLTVEKDSLDYYSCK